MLEINEIAWEDGRYDINAFLFVLKVFIQCVFKQNCTLREHISGEVLARESGRAALADYGPFASMVFESWNVYSTRDIGEIVFQLVKWGKLSAGMNDKIEDFDDVFDLHAFLKAPYECNEPLPDTPIMKM